MGRSIPTIIAFDRGELTLSLGKPFDIVRVVGLVEEPVVESSQDAFVADAFERWRDLTKALPKNAPARFPHGWFRIDYALEGDISHVELRKFAAMLRAAVEPNCGWPMFWRPRQNNAAVREIDGVIEYWLAHASEGSVEGNLGRYVHLLVSSLFERFGVAGISEEFVASELDRVRTSLSRRRPAPREGRERATAPLPAAAFHLRRRLRAHPDEVAAGACSFGAPDGYLLP